MTNARLVTVGKIAGVFGVRGQVKVFSYTSPRENILQYDPWQIGTRGQWHEVSLKQGQRHGKGIIAQLEGCNDRDQAQTLVGQEIAVRRDQLPETAEDEYYWSDLEGLQVFTTAGQDLGRIDHLFETGSNDVMVVRGERERLVPFIRGQVVHRIDLESGRIEVDWDPDF